MSSGAVRLGTCKHVLDAKKVKAQLGEELSDIGMEVDGLKADVQARLCLWHMGFDSDIWPDVLPFATRLVAAGSKSGIQELCMSVGIEDLKGTRVDMIETALKYLKACGSELPEGVTNLVRHQSGRGSSSAERESVSSMSTYSAARPETPTTRKDASTPPLGQHRYQSGRGSDSSTLSAPPPKNLQAAPDTYATNTFERPFYGKADDADDDSQVMAGLGNGGKTSTGRNQASNPSLEWQSGRGSSFERDTLSSTISALPKADRKTSDTNLTAVIPAVMEAIAVIVEHCPAYFRPLATRSQDGVAMSRCVAAHTRLMHRLEKAAARHQDSVEEAASLHQESVQKAAALHQESVRDALKDYEEEFRRLTLLTPEEEL